MSRPEQTEAEPAERQATDEVDEAPEPARPPIDEDVAGPVNAALHEDE
jgi:hypothetical protein